MGVNVIRLHAADAPLGDGAGNWSSCRQAPLLDYDRGTIRVFNPEGLDRFDYLVARLKEKGIYLHIDLLVARGFLEGDDLAHPGSVPSCMKRYGMYNARLIELQKEYAKELLCHVDTRGRFFCICPPVLSLSMRMKQGDRYRRTVPLCPLFPLSSWLTAD